MKTLDNMINEAFDKPLKWKWFRDEQRSMKAEFTTEDGHEYNVTFNVGRRDTAVWFSLKKGEKDFTQANTGTGNAMAVFATVFDIVKDFIKKRDPQRLDFTGKGGREGIYRRYVKGIKGYTFSTEQRGKYGQPKTTWLSAVKDEKS
jgi:hypothetical protein